MNVTVCQQRLALLWFAISGVIFAITLARVLSSGFPENTATLLWKWLLPNIVPTLSLMIAVLVAEALAPQSTKMLNSNLLFYLAFGLSAAYLLVLLGIVMTGFQLLTRILASDQQPWMAPLQGLVSASLGGFSSKRRADRPAERALARTAGGQKSLP